MPFRTTQLILKAYYPPEEFKLIIVYAPLGYGKSAYAFKVGVEVLKEVFKVKEKEAWELIKQFIVFHPQQFFEKIKEVHQTIKRAPVIIWDDAGLWLYALDFKNPFIEAVGKYLNIARTHMASLRCTTPLPTWIIKKIRKFPQCICIKIMKRTGEEKEKGEWGWGRFAVAYRYWVRPDMKKSGVRTIHRDSFDCRMPSTFYWGWYKELRDAYEDMALNLLRERWEKIEEKSLILEQYPQLALPKIKFK